jgi:AraC-like DNA-binding protein
MLEEGKERVVSRGAPEPGSGHGTAGGALGAPACLGDGSIRVDAITAMPRVLRDLGLDPRSCIAEAGLDPEVFGCPQNAVPVEDLGRLFDLAGARAGCSHVGLLIGGRSGLDSMGRIGLLARHSPNVRTALRSFTRFMHLRDTAAVAYLEVSGGTACLGYELHRAGIEGADQICDTALAIGMSAVRALCGPAWRPSQVLFAHRAPADRRPHQSAFRAPLCFDAGRSALLFPATWLERSTDGANPMLFRALGERLRDLETLTGGDLVSDLRRILRVALVSGGGSVEEISERIGLHRRTLNRRLAARGTSLHALVEETRFEIARQLLENTRMPLGEIAATLGYAKASAFTRAFCRWSGRAPSRWRVAAPAV